MDTELLNISKEELPIKRKHAEQLEKSEEEFNLVVNQMFQSIENIISCIQQTVGILAPPCQPKANTLSATISISF